MWHHRCPREGPHLPRGGSSSPFHHPLPGAHGHPCSTLPAGPTDLPLHMTQGQGRETPLPVWLLTDKALLGSFSSECQPVVSAKTTCRDPNIQRGCCARQFPPGAAGR